MATTKRDLDAQLTANVLNLQHTVSWLGDQLAVLSTRSVLKCDWNSSQFCITPVPFNMSEGWDKVKRSLTGHQNLTTEIMDLERQILSTFSRTLPDIMGSDLLKSLQEEMNNLNPLGHVSSLIEITLGHITFMLCCFSSFPAMAKRETTKARNREDPENATIYKRKTKQNKTKQKRGGREMKG